MSSVVESLYSIIDNSLLESSLLENNTSLKKEFKKKFKRDLVKGATVHHLFYNDDLNDIYIINAEQRDADTIHKLLHFAQRNGLSCDEIKDALDSIEIYRVHGDEMFQISLDQAIEIEKNFKSPVEDDIRIM